MLVTEKRKADHGLDFVLEEFVDESVVVEEALSIETFAGARRQDARPGEGETVVRHLQLQQEGFQLRA